MNDDMNVNIVNDVADTLLKRLKTYKNDLERETEQFYLRMRLAMNYINDILSIDEDDFT